MTPSPISASASLQIIRKDFYSCSGHSIPRIGGECSVEEADALRAEGPGAVYETYTNWVFNPQHEDAEGLPLTDAVVREAAGEACYVCIEEYYGNVREQAEEDSALVAACVEDVTADQCIDALEDHIELFEKCAGYELVNKDMFTTTTAEPTTTTTSTTTTTTTTTAEVSFSSVIVGSVATGIAVIGSLVL